MRSAAAATSSSWVTMRIVWPSAWRRGTARAPRGRRRCRARRSARRRAAASARWRAPGRSPGAGADHRRAPRAPRRPCRRGRAGRAGRGPGSRPACASCPAIIAGQDDVLEHRHALEQVEELEHDADVAAAHAGQLVLALAGDLLAGEHDLAVVGGVEAGDEVEQRRLAAARRAHDRDELAGAEVEVDAAQGPHRRELRLERLAHAAPRTVTPVARPPVSRAAVPLSSGRS